MSTWKFLILFAFGIIAVVGIMFYIYSQKLTVAGNIFRAKGQTQIEAVQAKPIKQAKEIYAAKKAENTNFENSPCISEDMGNGWAVDIVHQPKITEDTVTKCNTYENGQVIHIIELTPDGEVVKAE